MTYYQSTKANYVLNWGDQRHRCNTERSPSPPDAKPTQVPRARVTPLSPHLRRAINTEQLEDDYNDIDNDNDDDDKIMIMII